MARNPMLLGARLIVIVLLLSRAALAQQTDEADELEPAVDTSAAVQASDAEREELEPGVPAAVLATDVTRQESGGQVMDRIELGRTEITGNSELPTVLYIVPWQKSNPGDLMGRPVNTLLDEVLAPIDREEFIRQVDYYDDLYGEAERK
ncbi:MAG: hypothetical protein OEW64_00485 [Gammaproteobacteria bacterium]|nr:hypothetical protein [Gammaproteobacteria bacterium]MDH5302555.1 hypothetical protein [Gammaproteobacteria bacterium]MDH5321034.1 hypothetical protein [Gammaproteobacteria bacterium]